MKTRRGRVVFPASRIEETEDMAVRAEDKLDLSNYSLLDVVVDRDRTLVAVLAVATVILALFVPDLQTDPSLESGIDRSSEAFQHNKQFVEVFGQEEFILVALKSDEGAGDPRTLHALDRISDGFGKLAPVEEVISLSNLRIFQKRGDLFGTYPVVQVTSGEYSLPDKDSLERMKRALPIMEYLISADFKTLGVLLRLQERYRFDVPAIKQLVSQMDKIVRENVSTGTEYKIVGAPLIRNAVVRYNIQTGVIFGILCMFIATAVSIYVFRSVNVTAISNVILAICVLWILGLMSALRIPLNSTTVLSFGFIPLTTIEIVIHMVVRYHVFHQTTRDKVGALKQAVRWLARPCFMCSATTAVGFGTLMVSSIPMVRQLGFIMSIGVMVSYALAMILTPALFARMKTMDRQEDDTIVRGWLDNVLGKLEKTIFSHHRYFVAAGFGLCVILFAGAPMIRTDPQILRMLKDSTPEIVDIRFVEDNLTQVNSLELMLEARPGDFKKSSVWKRVADMEKRLKEIPEVVATDSLLPLLEYLDQMVAGDTRDKEGLFSDPGKVPELLGLLTVSSEGKRVARRFTNDAFDRLHVSIRFKNSPNVPIVKTIDAIDSTARAAMGDTAKTTVTGDLVVIAQQSSELITDQVYSMFLAAALITALMVIQMGSLTLGLICLIPNIPPVAAVFGIMGWFGIALDSVTVFAATVAIGLAVDNTIHYLTQLKREIRFDPHMGIEECVGKAYRLTCRQISSWSTVTLFGFLALIVSPFRPVVFFGILGCSSLLLGLYGDLIFVQSLILSSPAVRNAIRKLIKREMASQ